jgi:hypothetical protein
MGLKRHQFRANWPAPDNYLFELGRMTSTWGTLENAVDLAISKFAGYEKTLDSRALILVAHSNFQQRIDIISSLCEWLVSDFPSVASYKIVITKLEAAQKARNKYAHNGIVTNNDTGEVTVSTVSARGSLKMKTEVVKIEDIQEATAKIHEAMCALHTLLTGKELKPVWDRTN